MTSVLPKLQWYWPRVIKMFIPAKELSHHARHWNIFEWILGSCTGWLRKFFPTVRFLNYIFATSLKIMMLLGLYFKIYLIKIKLLKKISSLFSTKIWWKKLYDLVIKSTKSGVGDDWCCVSSWWDTGLSRALGKHHCRVCQGAGVSWERVTWASADWVKGLPSPASPIVEGLE